MKGTALEKVYDYVAENPEATNDDIAHEVGIDYGTSKTYVNRLKARGLIDTVYEGGLRTIHILKDYPLPNIRPKTFKQEIYTEMVEAYAEDFKQCETFEERLKVGREIRIILNDL
ncbi:winged helix-turn-helix domain-containing protein [Peptostreptococcus equinus]|uniref:Winged helix-turn-helix domain-containing protein n=1 Tax=Peptostreptococcus equinus TaxID=3003601 RepID=A0ABY7JU57_9FIRM|nr:winged helix-turn-helix domain-containing protein [Peptostreptococcus sp. CBA3647]WAW15422.1 winged helix-turn-helix domain-containing protein [Peptostreptococcus sp. CBA3647]